MLLTFGARYWAEGVQKGAQAPCLRDCAGRAEADKKAVAANALAKLESPQG